MLLATLKESWPNERRVALVPAVVPSLVKSGMEVAIERGAGQQAGFDDEVYAKCGATLLDQRAQARDADVLLQIRAAGTTPYDVEAYPFLRPGQVVVGLADPLSALGAVQSLAARGVTLLALELMPRTTRAQSMDVLSSMGTIVGYRAVLLAASHLPRMFPLMMTAAGTLGAAKVLVIGAGVAGLSAIATAKRLGGVVRAYDVRPSVKEQVQSLGAKFLELPLETAGAQDAQGYAKAQSEDFYRRQQEYLSNAVAESDVVITTALVPGQRAPVLVPADAVARMPSGAVVVDLAAERGGNCAVTRPDEVVVHGKATVLGPTNLASDVPSHASQMFARNATAYLLHITKQGKLNLDLSDEIVRETLVTQGGKVVHPRIAALVERGANR